MNQQDVLDRLKDFGINPSVQRVAIMEYLMTHFTHPTVDDVFKDLQIKMPMLSRTTVYNTLRLLSENGAAQMLTIDERKVCYDGNVMPHVHFYCKKCERVFDIKSMHVDEEMKTGCSEGHRLEEAHYYFKGICAECQKKELN